MLKHLHIVNYALIAQLDINFEAGFSVITGETGAGKSILLGALGLLQGQRADAKTVKNGAQKCCVEAQFDLSGLDMARFFEETDIDFDGSECIVRRELTAAGKSRAFINDTPVPLNVLKELSSHIIDIHSQHKNLLLGHENFLLKTLDSLMAEPALCSQYSSAFMTWRKTAQELADLASRMGQDKEELEYLQFQLQQLDEASLQPDEQEELEQEAATLNHSEDIKTALYGAAEAVNAEDGNIISHLRNGANLLDGVSDVFPLAADLSARMESVRIELQDIAEETERAAERIEYDPARQEFVNERLDLIYSLQKKHHVETVSELLAVADTLRDRIEKIENIDEIVRRKEQEVKRLETELLSLGTKLTAARKKVASRLEKDLATQLRDLGMPAVELRFEFSRRPSPELSGLDGVTFLFSANKNMPMQDVSQIASGGEIARLMLTLKESISRNLNLPTIVFDEIDTGVSGTMAEKMARVMKRMGNRCQVVCITHLPQIAAVGTTHYRVYKTEDELTTTSHVVRLTEEERVMEIANMLSGEQLTEAAVNNAKALLKI